jgi:hypothetical protein
VCVTCRQGLGGGNGGDRRRQGEPVRHHGADSTHLVREPPRQDAAGRRRVLARYRSSFHVPGSWYDECSAAWLGRERRDRPGRPLAAGGTMGRRRGGRLDAEDATGLRRAGDRTRRRRGGHPGAAARRRRHCSLACGSPSRGRGRSMVSVTVMGAGGGGGAGVGRWLEQAVSEAPANEGRAPKCGRSSLLGLDFGARLESFLLHGPSNSRAGPHSGARLELLLVVDVGLILSGPNGCFKSRIKVYLCALMALHAFVPDCTRS